MLLFALTFAAGGLAMGSRVASDVACPSAAMVARHLDATSLGKDVHVAVKAGNGKAGNGHLEIQGRRLGAAVAPGAGEVFRRRLPRGNDCEGDGTGRRFDGRNLGPDACRAWRTGTSRRRRTV